MDPSKSNDDDDKNNRLESLMMAAIPRRSLPPPRPPAEPTAASGAVENPAAAATTTTAAVARATDALENMTIPRRTLSSKPPNERSGSLMGGSSHSESHSRQHGYDKYSRNSSESGIGHSSHHHHNQQHHQEQQPKKKIRHVSIQSEYPFAVKIRMKGVSMHNGGIPRPPSPPASTSIPALTANDDALFDDPIQAPIPAKRKLIKKEQKAIKKELAKLRSTLNNDGNDEWTGSLYDPQQQSRARARAPKRERISYEEVNEWDGLVDSSGEDDDADGNYAVRPKKLRRASDSKKSSSLKLNVAATTTSLAASTGGDVSVSAALDPGSGGVVAVGAPSKDGALVDAPPPGMLSSMWYSRECFLHIFVVEKIVGWKRRPVASLEWDDPNALKFLDPVEASKVSQKALTNAVFWNDFHKRTEVSRINQTQCPVVMSIAAEREKEKAKEEDRAPRFLLKTEATASVANDDQHEDVLLVKWRGRSYLHCSWERPEDIQKLDPSNSTARHKIRRYYQNQEVTLGFNWKKLLEEDRATAAAIHSHGETSAAIEEQPSTIDEFFAPQCLEVERILGCDENELDVNVLSKQRALNLKAEHDELRRKEEAESAEGEKQKANPMLLNELVDIHAVEDPWDPEDNVRYVVKWKGLSTAELTWEYWRDIKRDAVTEAEDFWYRQKPPSQEVLQDITTRQHPHVKDFRKIQESPTYGLSLRERPVAILGGGVAGIEEEDEGDTKTGFKLRTYQLEGVNWLLFNWWNRRSCILADEMGLGKTVQTLGFLQELSNNPLTKIRGPFLIVAPLSLIGQWQSEAKAWAPDYNVVLYHGSADAREFLVQQEFYYTEQFVTKTAVAKLKKQHVTKFHLLITTYEVVLKDIEVFSRIKWKGLIVDEAHRLKNANSRLFAELASVPRDHCVLLTGTPLANNTEELWALLHFDDPKAFADKEDFLDKFGQMNDAAQVNELHTVLKPYLLRRVKEDVEKSLPPKEETILEVTLTPIQKKYYKAIYERNTAFLYKGAKPSNAPSLMNVMMELRKICNHPYLVKGVEDRILADAAANWKAKDENGTDKPIDYLTLFAEQLVKSSGKMVLLEKLLRKLFSGGHKVLIFSQMVRVLDLLEELLKVKRYKYERLDGSTNSSSRAAAVDRFNRKSAKRFVMLLSTRAGGLGLNLTSADIVVIFDSDWNPQNDLQAMARAHRIGQTRKVQIFRLLTAKTYEMHMFHSASMKLGLERAVLSAQRDQGDSAGDSQKTPQSQKQAQAKEIDELLKKGAYDVFKDDDDAEAEKFMETDIDQLLEKSSMKVSYGASASSGSGLGSFSKASFVTDTGDGEKDVDLDDPDFWVKAVGLEAPVETPEEIAQMLDDGVKRSRKQVEQFNPYAEEQAKALKELEEKEEQERLRAEKRSKKEKKKKKKKERRAREELEKGNDELSTALGGKDDSAKKGLTSKETKPTKRHRKNDRKRALRRAANEYPAIERLKQAWEVPQRNRATAAALRFGFGRFNKIRHESSLSSLALQDLETFVRSYTYQLVLQLAATFLAQLQKNGNQDHLDFVARIREWMGPGSEVEIDWLSSSVYSVIEHHMEVQSHRRCLRMPLILAESSFALELRQGGALRALRRLGILSRLNHIIVDGFDSVLSVLGHEELAKRGCGTIDLSTLDADLRARHVSTEELSLAIGAHYRKIVNLEAPAAWWDRNCDISLVIGCFVHGLGSYQAMRDDEDLPFFHNTRLYAESDTACWSANVAFQAAATASRKVFDNALESAKVTAALEIQAAVAAAASAAAEREQDALTLRKGGAAADAVISSMPSMTVPLDKKEIKFSLDDNRFVTLPLLQSAIQRAARSAALVPEKNNGDISASVATPVSAKSDGKNSASIEVVAANSVSAVEDILPMPDSRVLDRRLMELLSALECSLDNVDNAFKILEAGQRWEAMDDVLINTKVRKHALSKLFESEHSLHLFLSEYSGVGINGNQCGSSHRSLDDGTDYSIGSATSDLAQVAYGPEAPRYLRAIGVPMNLTRFAVAALAYAEASTLQNMLELEHLRFYGEKAHAGKTEHQKMEGKDEMISIHADQASTLAETVIDESGKAEKPFDVKLSLQLEGDIKDPADSKSIGLQESPPVAPLQKTCSDLVPDEFRGNVKLRAAICSAVLVDGFPFAMVATKTVNNALWAFVQDQNDGVNDIRPAELFNMDIFMKRVKALAKNEVLPSSENVLGYVEKVLLPFCLRLCVLGNGPSIEGARGSNGEFKTALGISRYPEPSKSVQSPLPDPCMELEEHSLEAVAHALAILRRVRLMRAALHIAGGDVSVEELGEAARSSFTCNNLTGLPIWWCPWIHDIALLVHAATSGLFSIIKDRHGCDFRSVFSHAAIVKSMHATFVGNEKMLPKTVVERSSLDDSNEWIELHAKEFPSVNVLERRLAFLCTVATAPLQGEMRFDNLPMFDHGGWPRL